MVVQKKLALYVQERSILTNLRKSWKIEKFTNVVNYKDIWKISQQSNYIHITSPDYKNHISYMN